ncbi:SH3 domain-containing protein [Streptomyces sp. NPDC050204]|uniref:SH3 domain-containing protein n=1 Tax=Streptomyces sp. NPDC050204 TaxID=3155514 RepID=UPI00341C219F
MSVRRLAAVVTISAAVALPVLVAPSATAVPRTSAPAGVSADWCHDHPYLPYAVHGTSAVKIRAKASTSSTALGVLYKSHKFTVHSATKSWVNITDKNTGVRGYVSATYVYRDVRMCLD